MSWSSIETSHTQTCTHAHINTCTHAHIYTHSHTCTHMHIMYVHTQTCTHIHTHTHTHFPPAPPRQPSVSVTPGLYDLMVMWTPYGGSPTHYTITLMGAGSVVSSSTSLTSTRFAGLLSDAAFSIAVVAMNCAGNATTNVTTGTCKCTIMCCHGDTCTSHPTPVPLPPTSIGVEQVPQSITTQLTITWTHVVYKYSVHVVYHIWYYETLLFQGGSVTQYNIMSSSQGYNVTSSPLVRDSCLQSKCSFTQNVETTSALYIVTMASINAVGVGPWSDPKQGRIELGRQSYM